MLDFQTITLADRGWIKPILDMSGEYGSEYAFGNLFNWRKAYGLSAARRDGFVLIRCEGLSCQRSAPYYIFPAGTGDAVPAVEALLADAEQRGCRFEMRQVTPEHRAILETAFPGRFSFTETRGTFDYLYPAEQMIALQGKKLHNKRTHINKFNALYKDWSFEPITPENIHLCHLMNDEWCRENGCYIDCLLELELCAARSALDHFFELELEGGMLIVEGKVAAFTAGERYRADAFVINIEKALTAYNGSYTVINQQFAEHCLHDVRYINREDDVDNEGLRKAKMSYLPERFVEKYTVTLQDRDS